MTAISPSQLATRCSLQLRYHRMRLAHEHGEHEGGGPVDCPLCCDWMPPPPKIATEFGHAIHKGIEEYLRLHFFSDFVVDSTAEAIEAAYGVLEETDDRGVTWDEPPRVRRDGLLYRGDEARMPTLDRAQQVAAEMVKSWVWRFGELPVQDIEVEIDLPLGEYGVRDGLLRCRLDITTLDQGLVDLKTSRDDWERERWDDKLDQMILYAMAYRHHYGQLPEYAVFHVAPKSGLGGRWQVIEVEVDENRIEPVVERVLRPAIRMVEADAFLPNRAQPFPHSEKYCDYWAHCPFGAKAGEAAHEVALPMLPILGQEAFLQ